MTPAAGPPMALSQMPTQPQPATPMVRPRIAPALLPDQNRPEVRNQLRQRRLRRSSNPATFHPGQPVQSGASLASLYTCGCFTLTRRRSPNFVVGRSRPERGGACEQCEAEAAHVGQCDIRSEVSLFELVFAIAPTAGRNLAVYSSCTANGEGSTSKSSGKHEPTIDAAFARYVGPASLKPIPILSR